MNNYIRKKTKKNPSKLKNFFNKAKKILLIIMQIATSFFKKITEETKNYSKNNDEPKKTFTVTEDKNEEIIVNAIDKEIEQLKDKEYNEKLKEKIIEIRKKISNLENKYDQYTLSKRLDNIEYKLIKENKMNTVNLQEDVAKEITNKVPNQKENFTDLIIDNEINTYVALKEKANITTKEKERDKPLTNTILKKPENPKKSEEGIGREEDKKTLIISKEQISKKNSQHRKQEDIQINENTKENYKIIIKINSEKNKEIVNSYMKEKSIEKDEIKVNLLKAKTINKCLICIIAAITIINSLRKKKAPAIAKRIVNNTLISIALITGKRKIRKKNLLKNNENEIKVRFKNTSNYLNEVIDSFKTMKEEILLTIPSELKNNKEVELLLTYLNRLEQEINILIDNNIERRINRNKNLIKRIN